MTTFNLADTFREKMLDASGTFDLEYTGAPAGAVLQMSVHQTGAPNQNTATTLANMGTEVSGTNYSSGGVTLDDATISLDGSGNVDATADDANCVWAQSGTGFSNGRRAAISFNDGGAVSTWELLGYSDDFGADTGNVAGPLTINLDANGMFRSAR